MNKPGRMYPDVAGGLPVDIKRDLASHYGAGRQDRAYPCQAQAVVRLCGPRARTADGPFPDKVVLKFSESSQEMEG